MIVQYSLEDFTMRLTASYATAAWLETLTDAELAEHLEETLWLKAPALSWEHDVLGEVIDRLRREKDD